MRPHEGLEGRKDNQCPHAAVPSGQCLRTGVMLPTIYPRGETPSVRHIAAARVIRTAIYIAKFHVCYLLVVNPPESEEEYLWRHALGLSVL
jgi:hypothetical protein